MEVFLVGRTKANVQSKGVEKKALLEESALKKDLT
jgi:hypothetical protein